MSILIQKAYQEFAPVSGDDRVLPREQIEAAGVTPEASADIFVRAFATAEVGVLNSGALPALGTAVAYNAVVDGLVQNRAGYAAYVLAAIRKLSAPGVAIGGMLTDLYVQDGLVLAEAQRLGLLDAMPATALNYYADDARPGDAFEKAYCENRAKVRDAFKAAPRAPTEAPLGKWAQNVLSAIFAAHEETGAFARGIPVRLECAPHTDELARALKAVDALLDEGRQTISADVSTDFGQHALLNAVQSAGRDTPLRIVLRNSDAVSGATLDALLNDAFLARERRASQQDFPVAPAVIIETRVDARAEAGDAWLPERTPQGDNIASAAPIHRVQLEPSREDQARALVKWVAKHQANAFGARESRLALPLETAMALIEAGGLRAAQERIKAAGTKVLEQLRAGTADAGVFQLGANDNVLRVDRVSPRA